MTRENEFVRTAFLATSASFLGGRAFDESLPYADMAAARASIWRAHHAGAMQFAQSEMLAAREKLSRSEDAAREQRSIQARRLAQQAEADADLAACRARAAKLAAGPAPGNVAARVALDEKPVQSGFAARLPSGAGASARASALSLANTRLEYAKAATDAKAGRCTELALRRAKDAVRQAELIVHAQDAVRRAAAVPRAADNADVEHYVYLATRRAETAVLAGKVAAADANRITTKKEVADE